jgi:diacylglycerol kinase (ATP)
VVCAEPDLQRMQRKVRAAVRGGCSLVIAAGGDGTVEAVAPALVRTSAVLGIIPLGTYNNLAACLAIPTDLEEACELVASGVDTPIDVGEARAHGQRTAHVFLEQASIGLGPLLAPVGEGFQKGHWLEALRALPAALLLEPVPMRIRFDNQAWMAETLLVTVCNAPRSAAALILAPDAKMDDGQLDLCIYDGLHQAQLASLLFEFMSSGVKDHPLVRRARAERVMVSSPTRQRLLVAADAEVIGETPARFTVVSGGLRVKTRRPG